MMFLAPFMEQLPPRRRRRRRAVVLAVPGERVGRVQQLPLCT